MNKQITAFIAITILTASALPLAPVAEAREVRETRSVSLERYNTSTEYRTRLTSGRGVATSTRTTYVRRSRVQEPVAPIVEADPEPEETVSTTSLPVTPKPTVPEIIPKPTSVVPVVDEPSVDTPSESGADAYLATLATEIHRLTNIERSKVGVSTLAYDEALAAIATGHSEDMAQDDYFSHTTPEGCTLTCRFEAADYQASAWGENIAWRSSGTMPEAKELAAHFVEMWMNSTGHRQNMLSTNYTNEGIGLAKIGNKVYATANFAKPR